ncbi:MAG TPA: murein biosynthesis integral membrane protein MurJ [Verrucomicrobiae bacterium]|nr:murein biosynthesis integral membrane protein MurJ [Verrucomicrobiae bacterium]
MSAPPRLLRSAGVVSAAVALSRVTGLVREMVMARLFGAGEVYDAFLLAFRIPNLTRDLFAEGALSSAFVPIFTQYLAGKGRRAAAELSNLTASTLLAITGAICILGMIFSPQLVRLLAPGFEHVPGKFELAVHLTRIMFPFLALVALAAQAMGVLNACDRYGVPALSSVMFNIASVAIGLLLGFTIGRGLHQGAIVCMAYGIVAGGLVQLLWQAPSLWRAGFAYRPQWNPRHPGVRSIFGLMLPAFIGNAAVQINVMVNTNLASSLTDSAGHVVNGPVSWLGYAFRFLQLPLGLFGVAIAAATLPEISRSAARGNMEEFSRTLGRSLAMTLFLAIPSSVGLAILGESMIGAVYQWGRFQSYDTHQTASALACYSVGLAGYSAIKLLAPAFYALQDARTPMLVSVASIAINLGAAMFFVRQAGLGHAGLALATSSVALAGAVSLLAILSARLNRARAAIDLRYLGASALRISASAALMAAACAGASRLVHAVAAGKAAQFADVAISIPLGAAVFCGTAHWFGCEQVKEIWHACYTARRNASRPEVGDPPPGHRSSFGGSGT